MCTYHFELFAIAFFLDVGLDSKVHTTLSVGACVGARSDVALTFAQMWEVLDLYTLHLFQCFFFNHLITFVMAFVGHLEFNLLIDFMLAFVRLFDGIHCWLLPVHCSVYSFHSLPP